MDTSSPAGMTYYIRKTGNLGSGDGFDGTGAINYNSNISPGPNQVGFDYSHIMADTQDRVPTVYIENGDVVNLDPSDPIEVNFFHQEKHNDYGLPTGLKNPELTTMKWHHGHNGSIVNGVPRIGYMKGGEKARWSDIDMADHFLEKADYVSEDKIYFNKKTKFYFLRILVKFLCIHTSNLDHED